MSGSKELQPLSPVSRSTRGVPGIDTHLDGLRSEGASLVASLLMGHNELMPGSISAEDTTSVSRVSESRSRYVTHDLPNTHTIPRPEKFNNTINLQKEYMDTSNWTSESHAKQAEATASVVSAPIVTQSASSAPSTASATTATAVVSSPAAGETKVKDTKAPTFFAWNKEKAGSGEPAALDDAEHGDMDDGWVSDAFFPLLSLARIHSTPLHSFILTHSLTSQSSPLLTSPHPSLI